jgi:hypothetical protein
VRPAGRRESRLLLLPPARRQAKNGLYVRMALLKMCLQHLL